MKKKIFSVLFALVLVVSFSLVTAVPAGAVDLAYEPTIGWWQSTNPDSGTAEYSIAQWHSADYSVHLEAFKGFGTDDYHEVYVANPTGVDSLDDLTSVTFWYYCPSGDNDVAPLIDVWLDMDGTYSREFPPTGDEEWLLGMLDDVTTYDAWVEVPLSDIEWVRATGGTIYGDGDAGLSAAKAEADSGDYATLGDCPVLAIGVETGGPGTYISSRSYDMDFYVDDLTINTTTYAMDPRVVNTTQTAGYVTIQEAIDAADPDDTISVAAGAYNEGIIVIDKELTIVGDPVSKPVIKPTEDTGSVLWAIGPTGRGWFQITGGPVEFENLVFDGNGKAIYMAILYHVGSSGGTVKNCDFKNIEYVQYKGRGVSNYGGYVEVLDSTFTDIERIGVFTGEVGAESLIKGCTYTGKGAGDWLDYGFETGAGAHATIEDNTITACYGEDSGWESAGVYVHEAFGPGTSATITGNTISGCNHGIIVGYGAHETSVVVAHYNNLTGNDSGVTSIGPQIPLVDATNNWWGHSSGPIHVGTNPLGTGNAVSDDVDYEPWLLTEGGDPYDWTLSLPVGWSIVSPDAELESWDAVDEELMCTYDHVEGIGGFTTSFVLDPITPMFIKTVTGGGIGFNYAEDSQGIFTTDLEAGWNLIGIPETDATTRAILSPLRYGVNTEVALATLASQGNYNPSGESFYISMMGLLDWISLPPLHSFDGYWAYLNVAKEFGVVVVP